MAKFCTKCGKPLVDGKPCDCSKAKEKEEKSIKKEEVVIKEEEAENDEEETTSQVGNAINDFIDIIKGMLKKPTETITKYLNIKYFNIAIVSICLNAILFGVFTHVFVDNCLKKFGYSLSNIQALIQAATSEISDLGIPININTNIGLTFGICMAVVSAIIIFVMYLMHTQVYKKKLNIKKIVVLVGICEAFLSAGFLLAIIGSFINYFVALIIFTIGILIFFIHLYQGYMQMTKTTKDQSMYSYICSIIISAVGFVIVFVLMLAICFICMGMSMYATYNIR